MAKIIGNYKIGKTLGHGKYSKGKDIFLVTNDRSIFPNNSTPVKYAVDMKTKQTYAVKIMSLNEIKKEKMVVQIKREIAIMKIMKHKHVVALKDVLQTERNIYIVMELVTGGELFDKIVSVGKFQEPVARRYFQQIVTAIEYCHQQGIAHRGV